LPGLNTLFTTARRCSLSEPLETETLALHIKIHFNIIPRFVPPSPNWCLPLRCYHNKFMLFLDPYVSYWALISWPQCSANSTTTKPLIMQFSLKPPIASFLSVSYPPLNTTSLRDFRLCDVTLHGLKDQFSHSHTRRSVAILYILINKAAHRQQLTSQLDS
jgi:hypothetical protein